MKVTIELKQGRCMTIKIIYDSTTTPLGVVDRRKWKWQTR